MYLGIDHIVMAVRDLDKVVQTYRKLGFEFTNIQDVVSIGARTAEITFPGGGYIEFIMPTQPNNFIYHHLQKHGEGIASMALGIDDTRATLQRLEQAGFRAKETHFPPRPMRPWFVLDESLTHGVALECVDGPCQVKGGYNSYTGWEDRQKLRNPQHGNQGKA